MYYALHTVTVPGLDGAGLVLITCTTRAERDRYVRFHPDARPLAARAAARLRKTGRTAIGRDYLSLSTVQSALVDA
jgi:hypothetical protein